MWAWNVQGEKIEIRRKQKEATAEKHFSPGEPANKNPKVQDQHQAAVPLHHVAAVNTRLSNVRDNKAGVCFSKSMKALLVTKEQCAFRLAKDKLARLK